MKIALVHDSTTYWLAGQVGVNERVFSSAANLEFTGQIIVQGQDRVRAASRAWRDRKNYSSGVSFTTTRKFPTLAEAEEFAALYDAVTPRTGHIEFYGSSDVVVAILDNAIVNPPTRKITGVSVELRYSVVGGGWVLPEGYEDYLMMGGEFITMGGDVILLP